MASKYDFSSIVGSSDAIQAVFALMESAIDSNSDVLITGETGTGKELVARTIHDKSSRGDKPLLVIDCGAVHKEALLNELFGHRTGAFNGAIEEQMGLFEAADGGALILDDIDAMPHDVQPSLLRVLMERKVQRLGETISRAVDVRPIAITSHDLTKLVQIRRFRENLHARLKAFEIHIPPLRERTEDIPLLAEHFYEEACRQLPRVLTGFTPAVREMLCSYPWPGNARELRSVIRRACTLAEAGKRIQMRHLPSEIIHHESTQ